MDAGIPHNVRKAMANQAAAGPHPEPDLLNAYAERALSPAEDTHVAGHLATCAECRNVMFLAHSAANAPIELAENPAPARMTWFRWALPATAALAIAIALVTIKQADLRQQAPAAGQEAVVTRQAEKTNDQFSSVEAQPTKTNSEQIIPERKSTDKTRHEVNGLAGKMPATKTIQAKPARMPALAPPPPPPRASDHLATTLARPVAALPQAPAKTAPLVAMSTQPVPNTNAQSSTKASNGPSQQRLQNQTANSTVDVTAVSEAVEVTAANDKIAPAPAAAPQTSFKNSGVGALAYSDPSADMTAKRGTLSRMASQVWRISSDGHVERMIQNQWHRALNGVQKSFRVVAYVQDHVWAGGSGPELFHSADGGDNWDTIKVKTADSEFNGTMQTIRASDAQHLAIIADDGSTWTTADGGQTWAKQQ